MNPDKLDYPLNGSIVQSVKHEKSSTCLSHSVLTAAMNCQGVSCDVLKKYVRQSSHRALGLDCFLPMPGSSNLVPRGGVQCSNS